MYLTNSDVVKVIGMNMIFNTIFISNIKSLKSAMNIKKNFNNIFTNDDFNER